ncbi:MAG: hypothetical protein HUU20_21925 [Pirellulales bacterium]|nr:hypothetical protein [Pirellulales bacterium]
MRTKTTWALTAGAVLLVTAAGCGDYQPAAVPPPQTAAPATPPVQVAPPQMVREVADVGVGKKGRDYGPGLVTTPVATYFAAREKIAFQVQIPHAMNLYKGANGHAPKSQEEFMEQIIKANQINLPELPEGHRYVYDPQTEQFLVEHPQ